jgi:glucose/arabinose dehydrogenase
VTDRVVLVVTAVAGAALVGLIGGGIAHAQDGKPRSGQAPPSEPEVAAPEGPAVGIETYADGLTAPVYLTQPNGDERRFIVDQAGEIRIVEDDSLLDEPFLDLSQQLVELDRNYDERGLLGLAFHPDYDDNGRFFVYYSAPLAEDAPEGWDHTSVLSEFRVDPDDSNRADPESERVVATFDQPFNNHNAGQILFGEDGMLYVPLGDGGNGGDVDPDDDDRGRPPRGHAQTPSTLLGSILRIDVDVDDETGAEGGDGYAVPDDNPFADADGVEPEIWAYGLRNPYGLSRDLETGDLYVADAGQARWEEINEIERGGNYGWNIREGPDCFDPDDFGRPPERCRERGYRDEPLIEPVVSYLRSPDEGSVIVPAIRYRGSELDELEGRLLFGDYARIRFLPQGVIYAATPPADEEQAGGPGAGDGWEIEELRVEGAADGRDDGLLNKFLLGIYQDAEGEAYALTTANGGPTGDTGEVFALRSTENGGGWPWWGWLALGLGIMLVTVVALTGWRRRRGDGDGGVAETRPGG